MQNFHIMSKTYAHEIFYFIFKLLQLVHHWRTN